MNWNIEKIACYIRVARLYSRNGQTDHFRRVLAATLKMLDAEIARMVAEYRQNLVEETSLRR